MGTELIVHSDYLGFSVSWSGLSRVKPWKFVVKIHGHLMEGAETQVGQEPGAEEPSRIFSPISAHSVFLLHSPLYCSGDASSASPGLEGEEAAIKVLSVPSL